MHKLTSQYVKSVLCFYPLFNVMNALRAPAKRRERYKENSLASKQRVRRINRTVPDNSKTKCTDAAGKKVTVTMKILF